MCLCCCIILLFKLSNTRIAKQLKQITAPLQALIISLSIYTVYIYLYNCRHLQLSVCMWGYESIKQCTGWNNLACTLQSSRKQLCARGHSEWALPYCEQAFNGFLTLVITEKECGHYGLKTNWPDETSSNDVVHSLYYCTHKHPPTPRSPDKHIPVLLNDNKAAPFESISTKTCPFWDILKATMH